MRSNDLCRYVVMSFFVSPVLWDFVRGNAMRIRCNAIRYELDLRANRCMDGMAWHGMAWHLRRLVSGNEREGKGRVGKGRVGKFSN